MITAKEAYENTTKVVEELTILRDSVIEEVHRMILEYIKIGSFYCTYTGVLRPSEVVFLKEQGYLIEKVSNGDWKISWGKEAISDEF